MPGITLLLLACLPQTELVLAEDFEDFDKARWDDVRGADSTLEVVEGGVSGGKCLQITATLGENTGGHLYKMLDPGLDTCHLRFYVKFEAEHEYLHHFVHLVGYSPPTRWPQGGAGERPAGDERFSTGIEPWGNWARYPPPGAWNFYSYWCEMKAAPDGKFWGNSFASETPVLVERGRWICVEIALKCNTAPERSDGEQVLWLDGREVARFSGIRWRTDEILKVSGVWMLYYLTEQPARHNRVAEPRKKNRVWFDEIAVAPSYVGPLKPKPPRSDKHP